MSADRYNMLGLNSFTIGRLIYHIEGRSTCFTVNDAECYVKNSVPAQNSGFWLQAICHGSSERELGAVGE